MTRSYSEKLLDPRWQRKRLEIMERADFTCESCEDGNKTLHVHHRIYRKGAEPWEYSNDELVCLCEQCHKSEHLARQELAEIVAKLDTYDIHRVIGFVKSIFVDRAWEREVGREETIEVRNEEQAAGLADGLNLELCAPEQDELRKPAVRVRRLLSIQVEARQRQRKVFG